MNAQDLKNSILQLAIQGKLVEQREEEGTAKELFRNIDAEKKQLIEEGKFKKQKSLPSIKEDEIPFDIPKSWEWVRVGDVGSWGAGATPSRSNPKYYGGDIPWLKTGDLNDSYIEKVPEFISEEALKKTSVRLNPVGSVLMAMYGATIGKLGILNIEATTNQACCACIPYSIINNKYLFYFLSVQRHAYIKMGAGGAQPNISKEKIINSIIPLPPLEEQKRIVAKIEELMPYVDKYDAAYSEVQELNKTFPEDMQKSILQYAVKGKLVEQREEETAEDLYKQIQEEKKKLIKEGRIKKTKKLPEITEEDMPYDIPENWKWVRLGEVIQLTSGQDMTTKEYNNSSVGIPYLTGASNIKNGDVIINRWTKRPKAIALKGDVLLTCKGTVGKVAILKENEVHIARQFMSLRTIFSDAAFIKYYMESYVSILKSNAKSMIPGIARKDVLEALLPLPPLNEQKRIVEMIEELLPHYKQLIK